MLNFSILNKCVKKKVPGTLNTHPVSIKRRIFCKDNKVEKEKVLKFGQDSIVIRISHFVLL